MFCSKDQHSEALPQYEHIFQNEFLHRRHKKQKDEDIVICECKYNPNDSDSPCGERCLNVLTSTECTPGYCRCGVHCKNQRFQRCEYAKTKLVRTEGRGWGLLADENIKHGCEGLVCLTANIAEDWTGFYCRLVQAGQFVIEYCGEVISWKEAKRRSQAYENEGRKDAFIISLNSNETIDATRKGSLARFINHSCQPNCETRKWNVLGEIRVGIFAKQDITTGTELAYDYNFEWYGGAKVRCLCGAASCSGFLGARSRGFQEDTYLWEDDDNRYSVEKIPLYDSAEDEPSAKILKTVGSSNFEYNVPKILNVNSGLEHQLDSTALVVQSFDSAPMEGVTTVKTEAPGDITLYSQGQDTQQALSHNNAMISRIRSNSACRNYHISRPLPKKRPLLHSNGKPKHPAQNQVDAKKFAELLAPKEATEEVLRYEETKKDATAKLASLYNEIRPAIEEHERDSQDSVATSVAEKWIEACCLKLKAEFDLHSSIIRNVVCTPRKARQPVNPPPEGEAGNEMKYLEF